MRIKRPLCLLSALAMALSLSACGPEATEESDTPSPDISPSPSHNIAPPDSPLPSEDQVTFASASAFVLEAIPLWDQVALEEGESAAVLDASGTRVLVVTYSDYLPDDPALQELGGGLRSHRLLICDWESGEVVTEVSISQEPTALCTDGVLLEDGAVCTILTGPDTDTPTASIVRFSGGGAQTSLFTCSGPDLTAHAPQLLPMEDGTLLFSCWDQPGQSFGVSALSPDGEVTAVYASQQMEEFFSMDLRGNGERFVYCVQADGRNTLILGDASSVLTSIPLEEGCFPYAFGLTEEYVVLSLQTGAAGAKENRMCLYDLTGALLLEQRNGPYFQLISDGGQALFMTDTNQNAAVLSFPEGESGLTLKKEGVELPNGAVTFCPLTAATCLAASGDGVPALYLITALP